MAAGTGGSLQEEPCLTGLDLRQRIVEITLAAQEPDPLAPVTWVVESAYAGTLLRRQLVASGSFGEGAANIRLVTLPELISTLASRLGVEGATGVPRMVTEAVVAAVLARDPGPFVDIHDHPSTAVRLADAIDELVWCELDESNLAAARRVASSTTRAVLDFAVKVRAELAAQFGERPLPTVAREVAAALDAGGTVRLGPIVVAAAALPNAARALLAAYSRSSDTHILSLEPSEIPSVTRVLDCPDPGTEVVLAVREAAGAIAVGESPDQIAVLYGSATPYAGLLGVELDAAGIAWHGPAEGSLGTTALARAVASLLEMAAARGEEGSGVTRTGLLRWINAAPVVHEGAIRPTWKWRRIVREQNLYGDSSNWAAALNALMALAAELAVDPESDDETAGREAAAAARTAESARQLSEALAELGTGLDALLGSESWEQLGIRVWELIQAWHLDGAWWISSPTEQQARERIRSVLRDELPALDRVLTSGAGVSGSRVETLSQLLQRDLLARRGRVGDMGVGVHVGPVTRSAVHRFARVVVVGAAEGLLPGRVLEDPLLPDLVRLALRATPDDLTTTAERIARVGTAYSGVVGSAGSVLVTYPRAAVAGHGSLPMSRYLHGLPRASVTRVTSRASTLSGASAEPTYPVTAADLAVLERLVSDAAPEALVSQRDTAVSGARAAFDRFHGNLEGIADLGEVWQIADRTLSASAIEGYLHCPYHFFVQRVLGVGTDEIVDEIDEASAKDVGTLLHAALERFVEQSRAEGTLPSEGQPWPDNAAQSLRSVFDEVVAEADAQGLLGWAPAWARRYGQIVDAFESFFTIDSRDVRLTPATAPHLTEVRFGFADGDVAVPVTLTDGTTVSLRGAIDRLDLSADGASVGIVDYKTGKSKPFSDKLGIPRPRGGVSRREKVQDLVYDAAARALHPDATNVKVSFVFVPDDGTATAVVASHVEDRPAELRSLLDALGAAGRRGRFEPMPNGARDYCPVCKVMGRQAARAGTAAGRNVDEAAGEVDESD